MGNLFVYLFSTKPCAVLWCMLLCYVMAQIRSPDGHRRIMFPVICYMIADNPEMKLLSGVKDSQNTKMPCHVCKVPREDSDNPSAKYELRQAAESKVYLYLSLPCKLKMYFIPQATVQGYVTALRGDKGNKLVAVEAPSLNGCMSAFHDANMGVPEGIHGALPADRTHHLFLGLVKTVTTRIIDVVYEHHHLLYLDGHASKDWKNEALDLINSRFKQIPGFITRDGSRYRNFPNGVTDLTLLEAKDYATIVQFWPYVWGTGNR